MANAITYVNDIAVTSLDEITAFALAAQGGNYIFTLDELSDATLSQTEDKVDITGKQGRKITSLRRNKAVTVSGTNGLLSSNMLAVQVGNEFEAKDNADVMFYEPLIVNSNQASLTYTPVGTTGNEVEYVYVKDTSGKVVKTLTQDATGAADKFTLSGKDMTFTDLTDGTEIWVAYHRHLKGEVLNNESDVYSRKCQLYIDATGEDKCGNIYHIQFYIPKADFSGQFDISLGGDQTTHAFEAEALAGAGCAGLGSTLWTYTIFGEGAADYVAPTP